MKERFARNFGKAVRAARKHKGWGIQRLEEECRIDIGNLSKIERGVIVPRLDTAFKVSSSLGIPLDKLIAYRE